MVTEFMIYYRGAVVDWFEQLDHGAESRCKVVSSRLGLYVGPAV